MSLDFEKNAVKGNEFVRLVSEELEVPMDKAAGLSVLCSMHLRNQLSHEESFQLLGTVACVTERCMRMAGGLPKPLTVSAL